MKGRTRTREARRRSGQDTSWSAFSPLLAELLASDRVDGTAFGSAFELRENLAHEGADVRRAGVDGGSYGSPDLVVADGRGKVFLERDSFSALPVCKIAAAG